MLYYLIGASLATGVLITIYITMSIWLNDGEQLHPFEWLLVTLLWPLVAIAAPFAIHFEKKRENNGNV